jgi:hypothetical protein
MRGTGAQQLARGLFGLAQRAQSGERAANREQGSSCLLFRARGSYLGRGWQLLQRRVALVVRPLCAPLWPASHRDGRPDHPAVFSPFL